MMPQPPPDLVSWRPLSTPMGSLVIGLRCDGNLWTDWPDRFEHDWPDDTLLDQACCPDASGVLTRYFAGEAVDPALAACPTPTGPPFHRATWTACRSVPRGSTITYGQLAALAGAPRAARAAGAAMRSNPLPLFIPCHRIVPSSGGIGGFAGRQDLSSPAVRLKYDLLEFESAHAGTQTPNAALTAAGQGSHSCI